jgi:hypothetical protein
MVWCGDSHRTAWKEGAFDLLPETYCGKGMYWDAWGIFVGQGIPEKMFVDRVILSGTGG